MAARRRALGVLLLQLITLGTAQDKAPGNSTRWSAPAAERRGWVPLDTPCPTCRPGDTSPQAAAAVARAIPPPPQFGQQPFLQPYQQQLLLGQPAFAPQTAPVNEDGGLFLVPPQTASSPQTTSQEFSRPLPDPLREEVQLLYVPIETFRRPQESSQSQFRPFQPQLTVPLPTTTTTTTSATTSDTTTTTTLQPINRHRFQSTRAAQAERSRYLEQTLPRPSSVAPSPDPTTATTPSLSTTPAPHQPPLSIFVERTSSTPRLTDVISALRGSRTIAVMDEAGHEIPDVFVGPANLSAPPGFSKFDLPYLSALMAGRNYPRVDRLPFFVAPLSFRPPPGYSKIPFPAPHVGSVVVANDTVPATPPPTLPPIPSSVSLPADLPPISAELPALVNSLQDARTSGDVLLMPTIGSIPAQTKSPSQNIQFNQPQYQNQNQQLQDYRQQQRYNQQQPPSQRQKSPSPPVSNQNLHNPQQSHNNLQLHRSTISQSVTPKQSTLQHTIHSQQSIQSQNPQPVQSHLAMQTHHIQQEHVQQQQHLTQPQLPIQRPVSQQPPRTVLQEQMPNPQLQPDVYQSQIDKYQQQYLQTLQKEQQQQKLLLQEQAQKPEIPLIDERYPVTEAVEETSLNIDDKDQALNAGLQTLHAGVALQHEISTEPEAPSSSSSISAPTRRPSFRGRQRGSSSYLATASPTPTPDFTRRPTPSRSRRPLHPSRTRVEETSSEQGIRSHRFRGRGSPTRSTSTTPFTTSTDTTTSLYNIASETTPLHQQVNDPPLETTSEYQQLEYNSSMDIPLHQNPTYNSNIDTKSAFQQTSYRHNSENAENYERPNPIAETTPVYHQTNFNSGEHASDFSQPSVDTVSNFQEIPGGKTADEYHRIHSLDVSSIQEPHNFDVDYRHTGETSTTFGANEHTSENKPAEQPPSQDSGFYDTEHLTPSAEDVSSTHPTSAPGTFQRTRGRKQHQVKFRSHANTDTETTARPVQVRLRGRVRSRSRVPTPSVEPDNYPPNFQDAAVFDATRHPISDYSYETSTSTTEANIRPPSRTRNNFLGRGTARRPGVASTTISIAATEAPAVTPDKVYTVRPTRRPQPAPQARLTSVRGRIRKPTFSRTSTSTTTTTTVSSTENLPTVSPVFHSNEVLHQQAPASADYFDYLAGDSVTDSQNGYIDYRRPNYPSSSYEDDPEGGAETQWSSKWNHNLNKLPTNIDAEKAFQEGSDETADMKSNVSSAGEIKETEEYKISEETKDSLEKDITTSTTTTEAPTTATPLEVVTTILPATPNPTEDISKNKEPEESVNEDTTTAPPSTLSPIEFSTQTPRRRVRVKTRVRPRDMLEPAESQYLGALANALPVVSKVTWPVSSLDDSTRPRATAPSPSVSTDLVHDTTPATLTDAIYESTQASLVDWSLESTPLPFINSLPITTPVTPTDDSVASIPDITPFSEDIYSGLGSSYEETTPKPNITSHEPAYMTDIPHVSQGQEESTILPVDDNATDREIAHPTSKAYNEIQRLYASTNRDDAATLTARLLSTSTTTEVSHETEICYRGRCVKTKSSPDSHVHAGRDIK